MRRHLPDFPFVGRPFLLAVLLLCGCAFFLAPPANAEDNRPPIAVPDLSRSVVIHLGQLRKGGSFQIVRSIRDPKVVQRFAAEIGQRPRFDYARVYLWDERYVVCLDAQHQIVAAFVFWPGAFSGPEQKKCPVLETCEARITDQTIQFSTVPVKQAKSRPLYVRVPDFSELLDFKFWDLFW